MTIRRACSGGERNDATPKVAIGFKAGQSANGGLGDEREVSPTLSHQPSALEPTVAQSNIAQMRYIVRRLTPKECERLMGLPQEPAIRIGQMTNDEYVAFELQQGNIAVDFNTGYVYSMRKHQGIRTEPQRLKGTDIHGYIHHKIVDGKQRRSCRAHRIVWIAANGVPPEGMVIDHINNNKSDNRLCNLQLLTPEDNSHKAHKDGLYLCGDESPTSKLTEEERNEIRMLYSTGAYSYTQLAEKYNISKSRIAQLARSVGYTIPTGLRRFFDADGEPSPELVAEFQRTFDTFNAIMAEYEHKKPPKPKSAKQVAEWLKKISCAETCPDSPRYKGCGNGQATNQPRWITMRILALGEGIEAGGSGRIAS